MDSEGYMGVSDLAEMVFCGRAGILAETLDRINFDPEYSQSRLDYQPNYELVELEKLLKEKEFHARLTLVAFALALGAVFIAFHIEDFLYPALSVAALTVVWWYRNKQLEQVRTLREQWDLAEESIPVEPDASNPDHELVGWWAMKKSGFESREAHGYKTEELRLKGRPWMLLARDGWRIPVFRRSSSAKIHEQHIVRMAAYCRMLEECEGNPEAGFLSPYGLVLDPDTMQCVAIKNTKAHQGTLEDAVRRAREIMDMLQHGEIPVPPHPSLCSGCHLAAMRTYKRGETETICGGQLYGPRTHATGFLRPELHSTCGDRFNWDPPYAPKTR